MADELRGLEGLKVDAASLYREETFTDLRVATLRRLSPVLPDGQPDLGRKTLYLGRTDVMTPAGVLPIECEIDATSLQDAMERFPAAVQKAVEDMVAEAREMQRQQSSRLVVPGAGGLGGLGGPGGLGAGGLGGMGGIGGLGGKGGIGRP
jgi:hypothetical protein